MPLWAAAALPVAAYVVRSVGRGYDFTPDLPGDAIVFGILSVLILVVFLARRSSDAHDVDDELPDEMQDEHRRSSGQG